MYGDKLLFTGFYLLWADILHVESGCFPMAVLLSYFRHRSPVICNLDHQVLTLFLELFLQIVLTLLSQNFRPEQLNLEVIFVLDNAFILVFMSGGLICHVDGCWHE